MDTSQFGYKESLVRRFALESMGERTVAASVTQQLSSLPC